MPPAPTHGAAGPKGRPRWEVADVVRLHGADYGRSHPLPSAHAKILQALAACRTPALGGHLERCQSCPFERRAYNSCRNRHCPKCQSLAKARWLEARSAELLPVGYFHVVFTLPHVLNPLIRHNKALLLKFLFDAVAQTLLQFGHNPKNGLGGKIGFLAVLHTWDQKLSDHFHLHCLVPAGALSDDGQRWIHTRSDFLFPVKALSRVYRGKFVELLRRDFPPNVLQPLLPQLYAKDWVVYSKAPFGGPHKVLDYLGRYTHRVAISNHRIRSIDDGKVTFSYRDRADGDSLKALTLPAEEFIRRFLLHSLPRSFMRIRHFGFLANRAKARDLPLCRRLLGLPPDVPKPQPACARELLRRVTGRDLDQCPSCKTGVVAVVAELPRLTIPLFSFTPIPRLDSS